jgi:polynucleotide 5'-hydroxyl-kinase GRC3/NOL9
VQGDVTPKCEPSLYLHSIAALHATYQQHAQEAAAATAAAATGAAQSGAAGAAGAGAGWAPLVVNTQGWVSGLGLDLLGELLRVVHPTHGECLFSK